MSQTYQSRRRMGTAPVQGNAPAQAIAPAQAAASMIGNQSMEALMTGTQANTMENGASRLDEVMQQRVREHFLGNQIPQAEQEADRLAAQVKDAHTPEEVKSQLGDQLGADFSGVRFHTGAQAQQMADGIGARAYTAGNDVYFGQGGFDPAVAAHELVHTAQQGVVDSSVSTVAAPMGGVQMMPKFLSAIGNGLKKAGKWIANKVGGWFGRGSRQEAAPAPATPAPAAPAETFTPEQQAVAENALQPEVISKREGGDAYQAAKARYNATSETPYEFTGTDPNYYRYLSRHLRGKSDEEQDKMFKAFATKDRKAIAPYLAADIRNFNAMDYSALDSEDDSDVASAYGNFSSISYDMMAVSDFLKPGKNGEPAIFSPEDLGLNEEEMEDYKAKRLDFADAMTDARLSTKFMAGKSTGVDMNMSDMRAKREMRKLDRAHREGKMDDSTYRMMITPYQRYKREE